MDLRPWDDNWWHYVPLGGTIDLSVVCTCVYDEGLHYDWFLTESDEKLIPGRKYYNSACLEAEDGRIVILEDNLGSFTTGSGASVPTLAVDEHVTLPAGGEKGAWRFRLPADGFYVLRSDAEISEMAGRSENGTELNRRWDEDNLKLAGSAGETVFLFARSFDFDAEIWIESFGGLPTGDLIVSGPAHEIDATQACISFEYTVTPETADIGYVPGVAFSKDPEALLRLNDRGELDSPMWYHGDIWGDPHHSAALGEGETKLLDELVPNTTYYFRTYLRLVNGSFIYEPAESTGDLKSFKTDSELSVPVLVESVSGPNQQETKRGTKSAFRFTAVENGIYGVEADRTISNMGLLSAGRLNSYLADINAQAEGRVILLTEQMAAREGMTEKLKSEDQMEWVGRMNSIRNRAEEIIHSELIYS